MNDISAIFVIVCVAWVIGKLLKGIGGWFGSNDFRRDK